MRRFGPPREIGRAVGHHAHQTMRPRRAAIRASEPASSILDPDCRIGDYRADSGRSKSGRARSCRRRWRWREGGPHGASFRCHRKDIQRKRVLCEWRRAALRARTPRWGSRKCGRNGGPSHRPSVRRNREFGAGRASPQPERFFPHLPPRWRCRKDGESRFLASEKPGSEVARARFSMDRSEGALTGL